ncbi:MAG: type II toxin-antitoxin system RelE/ParE family toxin [Caldilineae bacterium]|nr:MAG: type II toxin-antitoxin system RelE/ParE family toxin [Caldilineae bacterium]
MSRYTVYIVPRAWQEMKHLPGNMRQRVKRAVESLAENPRPAKSKALRVLDVEHEVRRLRLDRWRVLYAVTEMDKAVDVLAVRKRPPYDYGDLGALLEEIR